MNEKEEGLETRKENLKGIYGTLAVVNSVAYLISVSLCIGWLIFVIPFTPEQTRAMATGVVIGVPLCLLLITMLTIKWWRPVGKFILLYESGESIEKPIIVSTKKALYSLLEKGNFASSATFILGSSIVAVILISYFKLHRWYGVTMVFAGVLGAMGMRLLCIYIFLRFTGLLQNVIGVKLAAAAEEEEEEVSLSIGRKLFYSFGSLLTIVSIWFGLGFYNLMLRQLGKGPVFLPVAGWMLIIGFVVTATIGGTITILATIDIAKPLRILMEGVKRVRKGDLLGRIGLFTGDEIGILAVAFDRMTKSLKLSMEKEKKLAAAAAAASEKKKAEELASMNEELESTNEELKQTNEELESATEELRVANEEALKAKKMADEKAEKLEKMNKFMTGREFRMMELKEEVNTLLKELGRERKYKKEE